MAEKELGLAILSSSAAFGAWSAWNSSLFTAATFVDSPLKYRHAHQAMILGLGTATAIGIGIYWVYGKKGRMAAIASVVTGIALYAAYLWKLRTTSNLHNNGKTLTNSVVSLKM